MLNITISKYYLLLNSYIGKYKLSHLLGEEVTNLLTVLMYHGVDENKWTPFDVPQLALLDEIKFYHSQGYEFISTSQLNIKEHKGPTLALTFDDGNRNILSTLKELIKQRIPFTIAICPGVIDVSGIFWFEELLARIQYLNQGQFSKSINEFEQCKSNYFDKKIKRDDLLSQYRMKTVGLSDEKLRTSSAVHTNLNWSELRELVKTGYCSIACHTFHHDAITLFNDEELLSDLSHCNYRIKQELGIDCEEFICPFGGYNTESIQTLKEFGYKHIYLSNNKLNFCNSKTTLIDRIKGVGFGNFSLKYYEYLWLQAHRLEA